MKRTFSKVALFAAAFAGVALTSCEPKENNIAGPTGETTEVTLGVSVKSGAPTKATADEINMGATIQPIKNIFVVPSAGGVYANPINIPDITNIADAAKATNKATAKVDAGTDAFLVYAGSDNALPNKQFSETETHFDLKTATPADAWGTQQKQVYEPYSLFYFGRATNKAGENKFEVATGTDWDNASWAPVGDNGTVDKNTLIKVSGVKYAVAALVAGVRNAADDDFDVTEDNTGTKTWADVKANVVVDGLVINGQPSQLDFEFNRAATAQDVPVYVAAATTAFQADALAFAGEGKVTGANFYSVVAEDGGDGDDVVLQFRFKNNGAESFWVGQEGAKEEVAAGKYFYTNAIVRYEATDGQTDLTTIFKKATTTLVNASLKDLSKATAEPEEPTEATIGVEIDATWNSGHIYDVDM